MPEESHMKSLAVAVAVIASFAAIQAQEVYKVGNGVSAPVVIRQINPEYTPEALAAGIQGVVALETVVQPDGNVRDVKIVKSLDDVLGLDRQAVNAAKEWRFKPGTKDGKAVAVSVTLEMRFTLK
jgi:periplasmic protein TonB